MNRFDLIIFDCDGVLIDSETLGSRALSEAMGTVGHDMSIPNVEATFSGAGEVETRALLNAKGLPADVIMKTAARKLSALFAQGVDPIEGIESVLENQHVKICVASNSSVARLNDSLGRTPLAAFFGQHIYSANHVAVGKPAPDLAFHCLERMSTSAERAIFVDDNTHGVCCARDAGVLAIGFIGPSDHRPDHA
ncbi:HAD-IA family hydrolase [Sulfitobacter geojensis]|uniref:HAD-IA family hydrolase n=1 Tax=Sulfitobacter geojensis TaxID=1342299 RepID=UPI003B8E2275